MASSSSTSSSSVYLNNVVRPIQNYVAVTLTTLPSRVPYIDRVLKSWLEQTRMPDQIFIQVPRYSVKEHCKYPAFSKWIVEHPFITIHECMMDDGPITKLTGLLDDTDFLLEQKQWKQKAHHHDMNTLILVTDDDVLAQPNTVEHRLNTYLRHPNSAVSGDGWTLCDLPHFLAYTRAPCQDMRVDTLQGVSSYLIPLSKLPKREELLNYEEAPLKSAFCHDDVWISYYLAKKKIPIWLGKMDINEYNLLTPSAKINSLSGNFIHFFGLLLPLLFYVVQKKGCFLDYHFDKQPHVRLLDWTSTWIYLGIALGMVLNYSFSFIVSLFFTPCILFLLIQFYGPVPFRLIQSFH